MTQQATIPGAPGVLSWRVGETPIAVVAVETTGFPAGRHRVCELAICRVDPGLPPRVVFDSLIAPERPITGGDLHGLRESDLAGAPRFADLAAHVVDGLAGAVVAAYNAAFSLPFLEDELARVGVVFQPPHLGLMFLRPALGLGGRSSLEVACDEAGVERSRAGCARVDAEAAAELWRVYLDRLTRDGAETFADLTTLGELPFAASLASPPLAAAAALGVGGRHTPMRRIVRSLASDGRTDRLATRRYWDAVTAALADFELSDVELGLVRRMRELLRLPEERMRAVHARAFLGALSNFAGDDWLAPEEADKLRSFLHSLARLGWSPGE